MEVTVSMKANRTRLACSEAAAQGPIRATTRLTSCNGELAMREPFNGEGDLAAWCRLPFEAVDRSPPTGFLA
jgi:hypothetical protein